jgi:succinate dehydrogenase / fumarate reductase membrane anchor subunit
MQEVTIMYYREARTIQPDLSFEYFMWIFTRLSGIAMIVLAVIGMLSAFFLGARTQMDLPTLMRWTFFPNPNHVVNSNIPDVTLGWANAYWQIMEMLLVFFGASHGFNGLRAVVEDFVGHSALRPLLRGTIFLLWIFVMIVAVYVILAS